MVCLFFASSSRGRVHRDIEEQNYVQDYLSTDPGEKEAIQDIEERLPEFNQGQGTTVSYDLPEAQEARRRTRCKKRAHSVRNIMYFECKSDCYCQDPIKITEVPVILCKNCVRPCICHSG